MWALDRALAPVHPRSAYGGVGDQALPPEMATVLDPIGALTMVATITERVRLGTSVLVAPWYPPLLLARALTTLDVISGGRLHVGLGTGWSIDEYQAVGVPMHERGARLEAALDVLHAAWSEGPSEVRGPFATVARSDIRPKPIQRPGPPVLLAAYDARSLDRVARRADGWHPAGLPPELLAPMWDDVRRAAAGYGRDPSQLRLVVRANVELVDRPAGDGRPPFHGTLDEIASDLAATAAAGAHETVLTLGGDPDLDTMLDVVDRLLDLVRDRVTDAA